MATQVSNLSVALQSGTTTTLYASWSFTETTTTTTTTSSSIKKGATVKIKSGATYYNGSHIPDWVMAKEWIVLQVDGDRVVIDKSADGQHSICSAINAKYLTVVSGGGSSSSSTTTTTTNYLDYFKVKWIYTTGDKYSNGEEVWFDGTETNVTAKSHTWSYPANAVVVKVKVTPVSKTYQDSNGNTKSYWTGTEKGATYTVSSGKPEKPAAPSVSIEKYVLTATLDGIDDGKADSIEFEVIQGNDGDNPIGRGTVAVVTQRASFTCNINAGYKYRARCRALNTTSNVYSDWSDYSSEVSTIPSSITNLKISVESETSVKLTWDGPENATSYVVQYVADKKYFDTSSEDNELSVTSTTAYVTGLKSGDEWFFRVKARNNVGDSGWSDIVSTVIGTKPAAPTTWSSTTTAIVGEDVVILYWVHNTEDGSKQTGAEIKITVNGSSNTITVDTPNEDEDDDETKTYSYNLNISVYDEGAELKWCVRTKGITGEFSDWSIERTIDLYAPPTLSLQANSSCTSFPYTIKMTAGPNTQTPISYHIGIISNNTYETEDVTGEPIYVNAGQEVYSKVFNESTNPLTVSLSAGDVTFKSGQSYKVTATVSMNSGLVAEATASFTVNWTEMDYTPDGAIAIDRKTFSAYISPFCIDRSNYITSDVVLSVYRREHDGSLTPIIVDATNNGTFTVTDPHPSLDYARYRIVARDKDTSVVSYTDLPGEPILEPSIIIQWDEKWKNFDYTEDSITETPPWTGSLLRLPYNINISEQRDIDVSLIEYIGRKNPVSYYGTQRGESASWTTEIPKYDKETIFALRRLSNWFGDVYVREPSGTGYWANVKVSFSINHLELVVPVSIEVRRVEGGI